MGVISDQLRKNDAQPVALPVPIPQVTKGKAQRFKDIAALSAVQDKKHTTDEHKVTNTFVRLGKRVGMRLPSIPTGMPSIDEYVIQCGGVPKGRVVEIYGPESAGKTSLALHIIGECQRAGGIVAFVDAEHALDPTYASKILGVDVDELVINQPDSGEEALANVDALLGLVDLIVIDSVSALVPQAELNGEMGDVHMGLQARLMSQAMRKLVGKASKTGTTLIFINQIREKIGVMFGCFHYNARVILADGSSKKIGTIVNQRLPVSVLSYNYNTGAVETHKVTKWFKNGTTPSFLQIESTTAHNLVGKNKFGVTEDHMIFTPTGQRRAGDLRVGDDITTLARNRMSESQLEVAYGSVLGDGSVRFTGEHNTTLRIGHGIKQVDYCKWKALIFNNLLVDAGYNSNNSYSFCTAPSHDLTPIHAMAYDGKRRTVTPEFLSKLTLRSLAIWYLDDGTFGGTYERWGRGKCSISVKSYTQAEQELMADMFMRFGIPRPTAARGNLSWYSDDSFAFHSAIAQYVPPCMEYKIHPKLRGQFIEYATLPTVSPTYITIPGKVTRVYKKPYTKGMYRFDIGVDGSHNYFVSGVNVHNSPETTSGGRALKFAASLRLDVRRQTAKADAIVVDGDVSGHSIKVKAVKNKCGAPFRETFVTLLYDTGFDKAGDLISFAVKNNVIDKAGASYSFSGERIAIGLDKTKQALRTDPALLAKVQAALTAALAAENKADAKE